MLHRHRVPTIFSIYMLDVICCALGCVVLLWQVAHQEATEMTAKAAATHNAAEAVRVEFASSQKAHVAAAAEVNDLKTLLALLTAKEQRTAFTLATTEKEREAIRTLAAAQKEEIDKSKTALSLSAEQLKKLEDDLAKLLASNKKIKADLTGKININLELLAKIALSEKQITSLKTEMLNKMIDIDIGAKKQQEQLVLLKLSEEESRKLKKLLESLRVENTDTANKLKLALLEVKVHSQSLDTVRAEIKDLLATKAKLGQVAASGSKDLATAKARISDLLTQRVALEEEVLTWKKKSLTSAQELSNATQDVGMLREAKSKLSQRVADLQAEVDQRFAGVPLTGESIIFLIDVSGSMTMKDAKTADPDKWPFLCETLMQLMKSLGSMKRFQVIVFSDKADYLFGNRDYWMKYEGAQTAILTRDKLKKFEVGGNTNMHDAFAEAFRYRKLDPQLDTIYFFSDGLPNVGEGLPSNVITPTPAELSFHLGKHVRDKLKNDWNRPIKGRDSVRINAIGFFFESPDVGAFLWALARDHRGNFVGVR